MISKNELLTKNTQELAQYLEALKRTAQTTVLTEEARAADLERQQWVIDRIAQGNCRDESHEDPLVEKAPLHAESETLSPTRCLQDIKLAEFYLFKVKDAQRRHIEFSLTLSDMRRLMRKKRCQYTNIAFIEGDAKYQRSLERLDRCKGYSADNTVVVCTMFNELKNHIFENPATKHPSRKELLLFAQKMVALFGE